MAQSASVHRTAQNESVTRSIVSAVAELQDADPLDLDPLYDAVDSATAQSLFEGGYAGAARPPSGVSFTYCGCDVVVGGDGSVHVTRASDDERDELI